MILICGHIKRALKREKRHLCRDDTYAEISEIRIESHHQATYTRCYVYTHGIMSRTYYNNIIIYIIV